jgi:hypothetical protein
VGIAVHVGVGEAVPVASGVGEMYQVAEGVVWCVGVSMTVSTGRPQATVPTSSTSAQASKDLWRCVIA